MEVCAIDAAQQAAREPWPRRPAFSISADIRAVLRGLAFLKRA